MTNDTLLLRQVHPSFIPQGKLTSQAFIPFPKDKGKPSAYDGDQITAAESHKHYTEVLGYKSDSVWAVKYSEVVATGLGVEPNPLENFESHTLIDFTAHDQKDHRRLAKKLLVFAEERGCQYRPST